MEPGVELVICSSSCILYGYIGMRTCVERVSKGLQRTRLDSTFVTSLSDSNRDLLRPSKATRLQGMRKQQANASEALNITRGGGGGELCIDIGMSATRNSHMRRCRHMTFDLKQSIIIIFADNKE